jgi:hypothetical protein
VALPQAGAGDTAEAGVALQGGDVGAAGVAHRGAQPADHLVDHRADRALVADAALDALGHQLQLVATSAWK